MSNTPESPCISICSLDQNDVCEGCFRTGNEIVDWLPLMMIESEKSLRRRRSAAKTLDFQFSERSVVVVGYEG